LKIEIVRQKEKEKGAVVEGKRQKYAVDRERE
jgi:hypothetical protein